MKIGFIVPLLDEYDVEVAYKNIDKACKDTNVSYEIIFALSNKLNLLFTKIRNVFVENAKIKAFMADRPVSEHKLITMAMQESESYDAIVIYSGKEDTNADVIKAFISSWQAGNKIVYLRKVYRGFARFTNFIKTIFYKLGIMVLGIFNDVCAENDIQLLDADVVKTINQLPNKNQLLRTLDSLIYYAVDVIHLEVDPNEFVNPIYTEKGKDVVKHNIVSYVSLGVAIVSGLVSIILMLSNANAHFMVHLALWAVFVCAMFVFIVYQTKRVLAVRVGQEIDINELDSIKNKTEYYNISHK